MLSSLVGMAGGDEHDVRFLQGLRDRQLYELAETYCRDRLAESGRSPAEKAESVIELSRTLTARAMNAPPEQRPPIWTEAARVVADFAEQQADNPRRLLVRLQHALSLLAAGELTRQEVEVEAAGASVETARDFLRTAVRQLEPLADDVAEQLRLRHRKKATGDELTAVELLALHKNVQYQLARAYRNQAGCYPRRSADEVNALTQALEQLDQLQSITSADDLMWRGRIDRAVCLRSLERLDGAQQQLETLRTLRPPPAIVSLIAAEQVRLELARKQPDLALQALPADAAAAVNAPELDLARLETYVALWQAAQRTDDAAQTAQWQRRATELIEAIEQRHSPYWLRRAEGLLASAAAGAPGSGNLDVLVRTAQNAYRRGLLADAVAAYDRAVAQAGASDNQRRAFELACAAALIEQQRENFASASDRLARAARQMPAHPQAADAHWGAIVAALRLVRTDETELDRYTTLLEEHARTWPAGPSADNARWWLGRAQEGRGEWRAAIKSYCAVSPVAPEFQQAVEATDRCYRRCIDELRQAGQPVAHTAAEAARDLQRFIRRDGEQLPDQWTPAMRTAAVAASRMMLSVGPGQYHEAADLLTAAVEHSDEAPDAWVSTARAMLVVALAGAQRRGDAQQMLQQASDTSADALLEMIAGLQRICDDSDLLVQRDVAQLMLDALALLAPKQDQLNEAQRAELSVLRADALARGGRRDEALAAYRRLVAQRADDARIHERFGQLLLAGTERADYEQALGVWREVVRRSRPQSPRWYRAKYHIAQAHFQLGQKQQTAEVIRVLRSLHADLGGPEMRRKFEQLLAAAEKK